MSGKERLLRNCTLLIEGLQLLGIPLIVTQQYSKGLGNTLPEIQEIIRDFSYFEKRDFSCCGEDEVVSRIHATHASDILLCGIESHVCVLQTALDLKMLGFNPVIVADAVSSRFKMNRKLAADRFRFEGIMMTSVESVLFELLQSSASPEFKAISALVKQHKV